jgi:hypothetical protein
VLAGSPALAPTAAALAIALYWAAEQGGIEPTRWPPGALFLLATAVVGFVAARRPLPRPRWVVGALVALGAFTAWSYASIAWAAVPADAWTGSNTTLVYALVLAVGLWASWRAAAGLGLLVAYGVGVAALGLVELASAAGSADPGAWFVAGRFAGPVGYPNANAALFLCAVWPPLAAAARREAPAWLRAVALAACAVLLELGLIVQSRASTVALPLTFVLFFLVAPSRLRLLATVALPAAVAAVAAPRLLDVYRALNDGRGASAALHRALLAVVLSAAVAGAAGLVLTAVDRHVEVSPRVARAVALVLAALVLLTAALGAAEGVRHDAVGKARTAWRQFTHDETAHVGSSHLAAGLGSGRYDFWRVATDLFVAHPLTGVGTDNFATFYTRDRTTSEEPRYPHSLELRVLSQTGLVGAALLLLALGVPLVRAVRGSRRGDPVAQSAVAAGLGIFAYWAVHGSVDWLWEFPALSVPALAGLAIAARVGAPEGDAGPRRAPSAIAGAVVLAGAVAAVAIALPWLGAREVALAQRIWSTHPAKAFSALRLASRLDPVDGTPDLTAGLIHSRRGEWGPMESSLRASARRDPDDWYTHLELAIADIELGKPASARADLARARALDPREPALALVAQGIADPSGFEPAAVDELFLRRTAELVAP